MWTLECDGNILAGKKIWLRPGKRYLFGRTRDPKGGKNSCFQLKDETSVSRQHLTLTVSNVKPGDGSLVHTRSEISFKDEATKSGTLIDGDRIKDETRVLKKDEHVFKLGKSGHVFRIKWQPVVFTFSLGSKEMKSGKDPLVAYRTRLEDLDIKVIIPYTIGATTHVVSSKRNTAKGLQALINAKHIVAETYIDALIYATTPENLDELESLSPLEEDFAANWPNALEHLPAKSKEPNERPAEYFVPRPERSNVFDGYTFVFCDTTQFETLQAPITNGGGKALEFTLHPGQTTTEEIVRYVKSVAGEKGLGEFEDGSEGKGVVVVRFRGKKEFAEWAANLDTEVSLALGQRLIEQSEFMDAILINDASILRRPLLAEDEDSVSVGRSVSAPPANGEAPRTEDVMEANKPAEPEASKPLARRARARGAVVSRFKGFDSDDDDDGSSLPTSSRPAIAESEMDASSKSGRSQRYANRPSFAHYSMNADSQNEHNGASRPANPRKRAAPPPDEDDEEEEIDKLLPAAAAMKRRRIEEAKDSQRNGVSPERTSRTCEKKAEPEKIRKIRKEVNIKDVVRERREAEEEAARRDEENLREIIDGMNVEEMKNLAVIEEMELPDKAQRAQARHRGEANSRWDERWNGRKNFKKFRRRGEGIQTRRGPIVFVPLEEVKKKDHGIGPDYWLETEGTKKRKQRERVSQSQSQSQPFASAKSEPLEVPFELAIDGELPDSVDIELPRTTRGQERTQQTEESSNRSQINNGKRPASSQAKAPPAKKQKRFAVQESDTDSDDELKFRFKKKGR